MRKKAETVPQKDEVLLKTLEKISTSLATIANAVKRLEERDRIKHDAEVAELDARQKFHKGQTEMLEKTNTLFKNPRLEEYLGSLSRMVHDLGPEGMRKMTDASFVYTQEMLKSQKEFDSILGKNKIPEGVEIRIPTAEELDSALNEAAQGVWKQITSRQIPTISMSNQEQEKEKSEQEEKEDSKEENKEKSE